MNENEIINEVLVKNSNIKEIDKSLHKVCKSVCKITCKNTLGSGFLIKLYKDEKALFCLMTNEHVINKDMIKSNEIINMCYDFEEKWAQIKLNITQRFITYDLEKDITIIEIIPNDKIKEKYFLIPNMDKINYINKDIYIVQFPRGQNLSYSEGKIINLNNFDFSYDASTEPGSSGSPIILKNTTKVIGIHKKGNKKNKTNYGTLITSIMPLLRIKKLKKKKTQKKKRTCITA